MAKIKAEDGSIISVDEEEVSELIYISEGGVDFATASSGQVIDLSDFIITDQST